MKARPFIAATLVVVINAGATLISPPPAKAFSHLFFWHQASAGPSTNSQNRAGGGGIYGTGGPFEFGIRCADCHIQPEGLVTLDISVSPPFQMVGNDEAYLPNTAYDFTVTMLGEHKFPPNVACNTNIFAATFEDAGGNIMGALQSDSPNNSSANCPANAPSTKPSGSTFVYGDCHGILGIDKNIDQWTFRWTSPGPGAGDVTMWYGAVDGDRCSESSLGDDVVQGSRFLVEGS